MSPPWAVDGVEREVEGDPPCHCRKNSQLGDRTYRQSLQGHRKKRGVRLPMAGHLGKKPPKKYWCSNRASCWFVERIWLNAILRYS